MTWFSILKLGDCFKLVLEHMMENLSDDIKIVHASVVGQENSSVAGKRYAHAFILYDNGMVLDVCVHVMLPKEQYYAIGKVENVHEYTPKEAAELMLEHNHMGPWADDLIAIGE